MSEVTGKAKRLFVKSPGTDDAWALCGGPSTDDAMLGLMNVIRSDVAYLMSGTEAEQTIELEVRELSDQEVEDLPDL